ncbi:hypothetical protein A2U01_0067024, partial [Trifolium medium]|nr:hypothetical protein [Trifolium medium]
WFLRAAQMLCVLTARGAAPGGLACARRSGSDARRRCVSL